MRGWILKLFVLMNFGVILINSQHEAAASFRFMKSFPLRSPLNSGLAEIIYKNPHRNPNYYPYRQPRRPQYPNRVRSYGHGYGGARPNSNYPGRHHPKKHFRPARPHYIRQRPFDSPYHNQVEHDGPSGPYNNPPIRSHSPGVIKDVHHHHHHHHYTRQQPFDSPYHNQVEHNGPPNKPHHNQLEHDDSSRPYHNEIEQNDPPSRPYNNPPIRSHSPGVIIDSTGINLGSGYTSSAPSGGGGGGYTPIRGGISLKGTKYRWPHFEFNKGYDDGVAVAQFLGIKKDAIWYKANLLKKRYCKYVSNGHGDRKYVHGYGLNECTY